MSDRSAGVIELLRCDDCGGWQRGSAGCCRRCLSDRLSRETAAGSGQLYATSVVERAPSAAFRDDVPYAICLVDLSEGPRVLGRLDVEHPRRVPASATVWLEPTAHSIEAGWLRFVLQKQPTAAEGGAHEHTPGA